MAKCWLKPLIALIIVIIFVAFLIAFLKTNCFGYKYASGVSGS